jgi:hypothetical protein
MYLLVLLWASAVQEFSILGLGYIFSAFMLSKMLGPFLDTSAAPDSTDASPLTHTLSVTQNDERVRFWAACV